MIKLYICDAQPYQRVCLYVTPYNIKNEPIKQEKLIPGVVFTKHSY